jgi:hypothetical protein
MFIAYQKSGEEPEELDFDISLGESLAVGYKQPHISCRSSGRPHTSVNVCCRYGWLDGWICSPFIVLGGPPRSHLHPQFLFYPLSIRHWERALTL